VGSDISDGTIAVKNREGGVPSRDDSDALQFRHYRSVDGRVRPLDVIRRNSKLVPQFSAADLQFPDKEPSAVCTCRELPGKFLNLTPVQARTWEQILAGKTISDIARNERVSRAAIYQRIRGSSGRGGMTRRNLWVFIWWKFLQEQQSHEQLS